MVRMAWITSGYIPSPRRMAVIAGTTFTQLVRMKVFLFLGLFAVALLALSSFRLSAVLGPETGGINELVLLKNSAYGAMRVFGLFFCVAATALIIPKDAEDRILYTILCKPVPRIDYLMGKVLGVLALTLIAVLLMDAVMTLVLWLRTDTVVAEQIASLKGRYTVEEMQPYLDRIRLQGATWNVQTGLGVMMCEFVVLSSLTLLMSCMTNGTIISALLTFMVYLAGLFQTQALSLWVGSAIYKMHAAARSFFRCVFYLPVVTGSVAVVVVWKWMFDKYNGLFNYVIRAMGGEGLMWTESEQMALWCIILILFTTSIGQPIVLYVSALGNVDHSLVEAAQVDGATDFQVFWKIKWPSIMPTTLYVAVITTINSFQCFALIQLLTSGGPNYSTSTVMYYLYEIAFRTTKEFGYADAMGVILAIVIALFSALQFKVMHGGTTE